MLGATLPPDILSVDFYPLVEYCPHSPAGCSIKTLGRWSGGRPDLGPAFRQQSQKAPISFPFSVPLRKNSNSALQQDDLTKNPAQHSFFSPSTAMSIVINEIKEITAKLGPHPTNKTVDMKHPPFRHSFHNHGELTIEISPEGGDFEINQMAPTIREPTAQ